MATVTLISVNDVVYELGIRSLTAYLRERGHHVRLVFVNQPLDALEDAGLDALAQLAAGSDLIGISLLSHSHDKAVRVTKHLKQQHPSVPIVWGGIHATGFPYDCLRDADFVCLGEGELPLAELAEALEHGRPTNAIENLCFLDPAGAMVRNDVRPPMTDLDALPFQDYSLAEEYVIEDGMALPMDDARLRERSLHYPFPGMGYVYVTMTSRGCPFNCSFCCNNVWHALYGGKGARVRERSVQHFIGELEQVTARFPFIEMVLIEDDSFLVRSLEDIREFSALYRERIGLPFGIEMNPNEVSFDKLKALKEAGLALVHVGVQSGDEDVRRRYYHRFTPDRKIYEANRALSELGVLHKIDIIVDTPFPGDAEASLAMVRRFKGPFSLNLYSLRVYPGLALDAIMRDAGFEEWLAANDNNVSYNTIASAEAHTFALKRYIPFPPSRKSVLVRRVFSAWPTGTYWAFRHLGGRHLFELYRRVRLATKGRSQA